jgi:hypothetical protein
VRRADGSDRVLLHLSGLRDEHRLFLVQFERAGGPVKAPPNFVGPPQASSGLEERITLKKTALRRA